MVSGARRRLHYHLSRFHKFGHLWGPDAIGLFEWLNQHGDPTVMFTIIARRIQLNMEIWYKQGDPEKKYKTPNAYPIEDWGLISRGGQ